MDANLGPSMRRLGKELQTDSSFLVSQVRKPPERGWQATEEECRRSLTKSKAFSLPGSRAPGSRVLFYHPTSRSGALLFRRRRRRAI